MPGLKRNGGGPGRSERDGESVKRARTSESKQGSGQTSTASVLRTEEMDFPRGGGSKLTPFEHKQALREVDQETKQKRALKKAKIEEQQTTKSSAADDELFSDRKAENKKKVNREKKNAQKKKRTVENSKTSTGQSKDQSSNELTNDQERSQRIEILNYKRLNVGTRLFCSVLAVHPLAIVVSLPDQLLGHIPITNISETFTEKLEGMADDSDEEVDDEEEKDSEDGDEKSSKVPELRDLYKIGQWVHASVVALHTPGTQKHTRGREGGEYEQDSQRVELSLDPKIVNEGVTVSDLSAGFSLPLSVKSKEDHGYLMHTGIEGMDAFISFKNQDKEHLHEGQVVQASVLEVADNQRSFSATVKANKLSSSSLTVPPNARSLLPGNLIQVLITATSSAGLNVSAFGMFDATINSVHLNHDEEYTVGQKIKARIIWEQGPELDDVREDVANRKIAMSAAPFVVNLDSRSTLKERFPIGTQVQALVLSTIKDWGLMCEIKGSEKQIRAFTHISACSDDHIVSLPGTSGPFKIGSVHSGRVVGHALTDEIVQLSFQKSILERKFMRVSEVMLGEVIQSKIRSVNSNAIRLDINGAVDGVVFPAHFADVMLKKPEKKYKVGQTVNARVLKVDPERNRVILSLKKTLVQSPLSIVGSMQDARVGVVTHGVIGKIVEGNVGPTAVLVELFGHIRAYVPISEAIESNATKPSAESIRSSFFIGQCVKVRLTRVDYDTGRVTASIRQASESYLKRLNVDAVSVGETVEGKLAAVHQDVVVLELVPSNVRALLGLNSLAKMRNVDVESLRQQLTEGEMIQELKVLDKKADRGIVIVGSQSNSIQGQDRDLTVGKVVTGRVFSRDGNAVLLQVGKSLRCRLHVVDRFDDYGDAIEQTNAVDELLPSKGEDVQVRLLNLKGITNKRAEVSTRPSVLQADSEKEIVRDVVINDVKDLQIGQKLRGFVKSAVDKAGLFVDIGRNVTARIKIAELSDSFISDWKNQFKIGQIVEGTITEVDVDHKKVEMSLKSKPGQANKKSSAKKAAENKESQTLDSLEVGQKVKGFVRALAEFGVFVQIEGTSLSGLAHKSQLSDDANPDLATKAFNVGDKVKAIVLKLDKEKKKISFGLKPSLFSEEDFQQSEDEEEIEVEREDGEGDSEAGSSDVEMDANALLEEDDSDLDEDLLEIDHGSDEDEEEEDEDDDDEDEKDDDDDEDEDDVADNDESESDYMEVDQDEDELEIESKPANSSTEHKVTVKPALQLNGGFAWSGDASNVNDDDDGSSDESASSDDDEDGVTGQKSKKRGKKAVQEDLTANLSTKAPESAQDFERLLLSSSNSSFLWIQFISFQVQLGDVEKAKEVARRALQTIHFREEQEKFNVWLALLNLENTYGTEDGLEATFKEACQFNEAKAVHLRLAEILEQSGKLEAAQEHWKRTAKKFGLSSKVWQGYHRFLLRNGTQGSQLDDSRSVVSRSMQSLEKRKHIKTIIAYALDEFRIGDPERGRTIFEGLVDSYPKRLDIWWQYIDQDTKLENYSQVRDLFERILLLKLSSKKVKSILKKWLEFEKRHGDQKTQQAVLAHARRIVEEQKKNAAGGDEKEEESDDAQEEEDEDDDEEEEE